MSTKLSKYANSLGNRVRRASINHKDRAYMHRMSKEELEQHYSKYFSEAGNLECCLQLNKEFEQLDREELERYEKWLMESD